MWPATALSARGGKTSTASSLFSTATRQSSLATDVPRSIRGVSRTSYDLGGHSRPRRRPSGLIADGSKSNGLAAAISAPVAAMPPAIADELDRAAILFGDWASKVAVDVDAEDSDNHIDTDKKHEAMDLFFGQLFGRDRPRMWLRFGRSSVPWLRPNRTGSANGRGCGVVPSAAARAALSGYPAKSAGKVDARKADVFARLKAQCSSHALSLDAVHADRAWRILAAGGERSRARSHPE